MNIKEHLTNNQYAVTLIFSSQWLVVSATLAQDAPFWLAFNPISILIYATCTKTIGLSVMTMRAHYYPPQSAQGPKSGSDISTIKA